MGKIISCIGLQDSEQRELSISRELPYQTVCISGYQQALYVSSLYIKSIKIRPLTCKRSADQMTYLILDDYPKHVDENLKELKTTGRKKKYLA